MDNLAEQRIKREFKELIKNEELAKCGIKIERVNNSWTELMSEIIGPRDTPYEGGTFFLEIKVPETYPFNPPKIKFVTNIWHPNISSVTGAICMKKQWAPAMKLHTILLFVQGLLSAAEPNDPQDAVVAKQYRENSEMFHRTAKYWTNVYADGPQYVNEGFENKIQRLLDMGVLRHQATVALSSFDWDLQVATEQIFC